MSTPCSPGSTHMPQDLCLLLQACSWLTGPPWHVWCVTQGLISGHRPLQLAQNSPLIVPELPAFIKSVPIWQQQQPEMVVSKHPSTSPHSQPPPYLLPFNLPRAPGEQQPPFNLHQLPWLHC